MKRNANASESGHAQPPRPASPAHPAQGPPAPGGTTVVIPLAEYQQLLDDMRKMKVIVKGHEKRIKMLEDEVKRFETDIYAEDAGSAGAHSNASTDARSQNSEQNALSAQGQSVQSASAQSGQSAGQSVMGVEFLQQRAGGSASSGAALALGAQRGSFSYDSTGASPVLNIAASSERPSNSYI